MTLRRRLIPVTALVVAIGASAAGAATAAATGGGPGGGSGSDPGKGAAKVHKTVACKVEIPGDAFQKGADPETDPKTGAGTGAKSVLRVGDLAPGDDAAKLRAGGKIVLKPGAPSPADVCAKKVEVVGPDQIAADLGVSKTALIQALQAAKQWVAATQPTPGPAAFEQHLADLLHVPVAKVAEVFKPGVPGAVKPGA